MASTFEHLREADLDDDEYDEEEIDMSDLREKYEVQLDSGYDHFVVIDGLPVVNEAQKPKLVKFLLKKLNSVGKTREDQIYMPIGESGNSERYVALAAWDLLLSAAQRMTLCSDFDPSPGSPSSSTPRPPRLLQPSVSWTWSLLTRSTPSVSTS